MPLWVPWVPLRDPTQKKNGSSLKKKKTLFHEKKNCNKVKKNLRRIEGFLITSTTMFDLPEGCITVALPGGDEGASCH